MELPVVAPQACRYAGAVAQLDLDIEQDHDRLAGAGPHPGHEVEVALSPSREVDEDLRRLELEILALDLWQDIRRGQVQEVSGKAANQVFKELVVAAEHGLLKVRSC